MYDVKVSVWVVGPGEQYIRPFQVSFYAILLTFWHFIQLFGNNYVAYLSKEMAFLEVLMFSSTGSWPHLISDFPSKVLEVWSIFEEGAEVSDCKPVLKNKNKN